VRFGVSYELVVAPAIFEYEPPQVDAVCHWYSKGGTPPLADTLRWADVLLQIVWSPGCTREGSSKTVNVMQFDTDKHPEAAWVTTQW
jgi:hypothetical protein